MTDRREQMIEARSAEFKRVTDFLAARRTFRQNPAEVYSFKGHHMEVLGRAYAEVSTPEQMIDPYDEHDGFAHADDRDDAERAVKSDPERDRLESRVNDLANAVVDLHEALRKETVKRIRLEAELAEKKAEFVRMENAWRGEVERRVERELDREFEALITRLRSVLSEEKP